VSPDSSFQEEIMMRALTIIALVAAALGCSREGEVPQAVAVAMTAPQEAADKEVLIASQPTGAKILLKGAEVGATPMKLLIRTDTNVVLEKEGFLRQALMLTPKSDPNVVVTLVPAEGGIAPAVDPAAAGAPPAADPGSQKASGKGSKKPDKADDKPAGEAPAAAGAADTDTAASGTAAPPATETPATGAPPAAKKTEYATMRQIKEALHAGKITKQEYSYWQGIIRQKRQAEYDAARKDLRDRKLTDAQYEERIRAIKLKYEG
jgi:hypothetical protein